MIILDEGILHHTCNRDMEVDQNSHTCIGKIPRVLSTVAYSARSVIYFSGIFWTTRVTAEYVYTLQEPRRRPSRLFGLHPEFDQKSSIEVLLLTSCSELPKSN